MITGVAHCAAPERWPQRATPAPFHAATRRVLRFRAHRCTGLHATPNYRVTVYPPSFSLFCPPLLPRGKGAFACLRDGTLLPDFSRLVVHALLLERKEVYAHYVHDDKDRRPRDGSVRTSDPKCSPSLNHFDAMSVISEPHGVPPLFCALQRDTMYDRHEEPPSLWSRTTRVSH